MVLVQHAEDGFLYEIFLIEAGDDHADQRILGDRAEIRVHLLFRLSQHASVPSPPAGVVPIRRLGADVILAVIPLTP